MTATLPTCAGAMYFTEFHIAQILEPEATNCVNQTLLNSF
jgi:hypothetical protein